MADWKSAFDELVAVRGPALRGYAYLLAGDAPTAADLVQEALVRVFGRLRVGSDVQQLEGYVRRAILNLYVDDRRREKRWRETRHLLVDPDPPGEDLVTTNAVRQALSDLSPKQRACVVLRYYEDLTVPEIADQLGCAEGTVKRHLADARSRLAAQLGVTEESVQ
ncbi:transcriptional regulator, LuxR family [Kribbella flavida DSM 17836]|uniref:Transcriptional regulator, LuxR family n=1 Tax=Kribbella flavida (strain DSM 17836 / JCM 10339 / NBRC 14399) TaxID=479435 RepID=D2PQL8_KRIFD|nr:SigE family RNA polymerase sigma factor [Kribbella flavida]ADB29205.1 transcriptional regulator, LuxR family [Kribbella flavida DSM 17836]